MQTICLIIFVITLLLCLSTYVMYPAVIFILARMFGQKKRKSAITPYVSILISAYNESRDIWQKIQNTLHLDYPIGKMEILIGSDGSTDNTVAIVKNLNHDYVRVFDFQINRGKTAVQNDLVKESRGEILVFTDAASFLRPDALRKLVCNFADDDVGCVAGRMLFVDTDATITTQSQGHYWRYESAIRELESSLGSLIGVDGPLYAVRRDHYVMLEPHVISDFITPLLILRDGKKVIWEKEAIVEEAPTIDTVHEFSTRRRITLRGLTGLKSHCELLDPWKHPALSFQIIFHKLLRWSVGPLAFLNFLVCIPLLDKIFFSILFIGYIAFGTAALLGWVAARSGKKNRLLAIPYYFMLVNLAASIGILDFLMKKQRVAWEPVRP